MEKKFTKQELCVLFTTTVIVDEICNGDFTPEEEIRVLDIGRKFIDTLFEERGCDA